MPLGGEGPPQAAHYKAPRTLARVREKEGSGEGEPAGLTRQASEWHLPGATRWGDPQDFSGARLEGQSCPGAVPAWAGAKPEARAAMGKVYGPAPWMGLPLPLAQGSLDLRHSADCPQSCPEGASLPTPTRKQRQSSVSEGASGL